MEDAQRAVDELCAAGFEAELFEGKALPFVPTSSLPTAAAKIDLIRALRDGRLPSVGGGEIFAEGMVFVPRRPGPAPTGFPYDEPEVMEKYGVDPPERPGAGPIGLTMHLRIPS